MWLQIHLFPERSRKTTLKKTTLFCSIVQKGAGFQVQGNDLAILSKGWKTKAFAYSSLGLDWLPLASRGSAVPATQPFLVESSAWASATTSSEATGSPVCASSSRLVSAAPALSFSGYQGALRHNRQCGGVEGGRATKATWPGSCAQDSRGPPSGGQDGCVLAQTAPLTPPPSPFALRGPHGEAAAVNANEVLTHVSVTSWRLWQAAAWVSRTPEGPGRRHFTLICGSSYPSRNAKEGLRPSLPPSSERCCYIPVTPPHNPWKGVLSPGVPPRERA